MLNSELALMTATDAARRLKACPVTLKRKIAKAGIQPDAVLVEGSTGRRSALFVEPRLAELARLINVNPEPVSL